MTMCFFIFGYFLGTITGLLALGLCRAAADDIE